MHDEERADGAVEQGTPGEDLSLVEMVRLGERMIDIHLSSQQAVERRAADLMKVAMASIGAVAVVVGLLRAVDSELTMPPVLIIGSALIMMLASGFLLATIMVGYAATNGFLFGPRFQAIVDHREWFHHRPDLLRASLVESMPQWMAQNERTLLLETRRKSLALWLLVAGVLLLLLALVYILGGSILG